MAKAHDIAATQREVTDEQRRALLIGLTAYKYIDHPQLTEEGGIRHVSFVTHSRFADHYCKEFGASKVREEQGISHLSFPLHTPSDMERLSQFLQNFFIEKTAARIAQLKRENMVKPFEPSNAALAVDRAREDNRRINAIFSKYASGSRASLEKGLEEGTSPQQGSNSLSLKFDNTIPAELIVTLNPYKGNGAVTASQDKKELSIHFDKLTHGLDPERYDAQYVGLVNAVVDLSNWQQVKALADNVQGEGKAIAGLVTAAGENPRGFQVKLEQLVRQVEALVPQQAKG